MRNIDTQELADMRREVDQLTVINVLPPEKFRNRHIPDTINIPVDEDDFVQKVEAAAGSRDRPVVVYCASEGCDASENAAEKLDQAGFRQVYDYVGGCLLYTSDAADE